MLFVLSNIIDDEKLCTALQVHIIALSKKIDLDSFYEKEVDLDTVDEDEKYGYFIIGHDVLHFIGFCNTL